MDLDNAGIEKIHLFNIWHKEIDKKMKVDRVFDEICRLYKIEPETTENNVLMEIKEQTRTTCGYFNKIWQDHHRTYEVVMKKKADYFKTNFVLPSTITVNLPSTSGMLRVGRPTREFDTLSITQKRKRTSDLRENVNPVELAYATQMSLKSVNKDAAKIVREATQTSPTRAQKMLKSWRKSKSSETLPNSYTAEKALALIMDTNLTVTAYKRIRQGAKSLQHNIYPPYYIILAEKKKCYPTSITVTELMAEVKLQDLLDHTATRLLMNKPAIHELPNNEVSQLTVTYKWGFDGSTGHSEYKQRYSDGSTTSTDTSIFLTSLVPLTIETSGNQTIFTNPCPSSTRFCRPIRIQFIKETAEISVNEKTYIEQQIENLQSTQTEVDGKQIKINHKLIFSMIDGKVCNAITETTSAQKCYICGATPKMMNNISSAKQRPVSESSLQYGLSTLHAWIRFFEYFLHLSYRIEFQKWQARGENLTSLNNRKKVIQNQFKNKMGLLVDKVRPGGAGTSNDGNTARRFFKNPQLSAEITGLNATLLERCGNILTAISSGYQIESGQFEEYCLHTANMLVQEYPWYYMPATVHKILLHGPLIVSKFILPIGMLSEEAQEARNKDLKYYREHHTRKISRTDTNLDLIHALLVSSDPHISSLRQRPVKNHTKLSEAVISLLVLPEDVANASSDEEHLSTSSDYEFSDSD